jgi:hypothetical protein
MSRADLEILHDTSAFNPSPRHQELYATHVPFDTMTGTHSCEQALAAALRRSERVTLVGTSGAGKSSVIAATLHPLVEDLVPLAIPVAVERPAVAGDPVAFVRHLVQVVSRLVQLTEPERGRQARAIESETQPKIKRGKGFSVAPGLAGVSVRLAYELEAAVQEPSTTSDQIMDQGRQILDLFRSRGLTPVLVLDDTDRWLSTTWLPESGHIRSAFFNTIPRLMSEELAAAAVIAVHPTYLDDAAFRAARGFLSRSITVPQVPSAGAVSAILYRRIGLAFGARGLPAVEVGDVLADAALVTVHDYYSSSPSDVRRNVLLVLHAALTLAVDDPEAERIDRRHVELAIAEGEG